MKFKIMTLGCKVNLYESNFISESLIKKGFTLANDDEKCDVVIINTCTVTDTSDHKSLKMVRKCKRENPDSILVVCGCSSQNNPDVYQNMDIDILIGNKQKSLLADIIFDYIKDREKYFYITNKRDTDFEDMQIDDFEHIRAFIKVQDGCNNFCSYCIIPYVRGDIRSKKFTTCINEAKTLASKGFKEIVLTGIHTGTYYDDGKDLTDLINELSLIEGIERIRLSSVEITELNEKFLNMLKTNNKFCKHLHIPLQAGSDEILKRMNRKYDTEYFESKINQIRSICPDISITTDVIVGHNYETDELFKQSLEFCKKINFAKIHVFPYSERKGTASEKMPEKVDIKVRKKRALELIELSNQLEKDYYNKFIGKTLDVLIETNKDGASFGHTSNYLNVKIDKILEIGSIYKEQIK